MENISNYRTTSMGLYQHTYKGDDQCKNWPLGAFMNLHTWGKTMTFFSTCSAKCYIGQSMARHFAVGPDRCPAAQWSQPWVGVMADQVWIGHAFSQFRWFANSDLSIVTESRHYESKPPTHSELAPDFRSSPLVCQLDGATSTVAKPAR